MNSLAIYPLSITITTRRSRWDPWPLPITTADYDGFFLFVFFWTCVSAERTSNPFVNSDGHGRDSVWKQPMEKMSEIHGRVLDRALASEGKGEH